MRILLSDGSGLTSRQLATLLHRHKGHEVHVLCPPGLALTKFTTHVKKTHTVPQFGPDPYRWLDAALKVCRAEKIDLFLPSQEQVAVLSAECDVLREMGLRCPIPKFDAVRQVLDKISAFQTLEMVGLRQPESVIVRTARELREKCREDGWVPGFAKVPLGTASKGVFPVRASEDVDEVAEKLERRGVFNAPDVEDVLEIEGKIVFQKYVPGPLYMVSAVFREGTMLAWTCALRAREGISGGAAGKMSWPILEIRRDVEKLGRFLEWDGALSLDAIVNTLPDGRESVYYIDINPRIVEPVNGWLAGVDLVGALLEVGVNSKVPAPDQAMQGRVKDPRPGVMTHQLVLALAISVVENGRLGLVREIWMVVTETGPYGPRGVGERSSVEELTPLDGDPLSGVLLGLMVLLLLVGGRWAVRVLDGGTVANYALSIGGWRRIVRRRAG